MLPRKFCFCISLENGGFALGIIGIAWCFFIEWMLSTTSISRTQVQHFLNLICLSVYVLILVGSRTGHSLLILPWLLLVPIHVIGLFILNFICIYYIYVIDEHFSSGLCVLLVIIMMMLIYFWLCMINLYITFQRKERAAKGIIAKDIQKDGGIFTV